MTSSISKVVDIIEQEKGKYRFHIGSLCGRDEDERRCTIGLLMSHFGWNGSREISYSFEHANKKVNERRLRRVSPLCRGGNLRIMTKAKSYVLHKVGDLFPSQDIMFLAGMTDKTLFHGRGILEMNVLNRKSIDPRGNFPREADACVVMVVQSTTTQPR